MLPQLDERMESIRSSKLIASAHLMSLPSAFQPGSSCHACQFLLMAMAMPKPELASEKVSMSLRGVEPGMGLDRVLVLRSLAHQIRS